MALVMPLRPSIDTAQPISLKYLLINLVRKLFLPSGS